MLDKELEKLLDEIENRLELGLTVSEIANEMSVKYKAINDTIELARPNQERYNHLITLRSKNKKSVWQSDQGFHLYQYNIAKSIANKETSLEKIRLKYNTSIVYMLLYFTQIKEKELYEKLKPTLQEYGFLEEEKTNIVKLKEYPESMQKEIVLLGLTYRISFQNLARIFNTTVIEIANLFFRMEIPRNAVDALFLETLREKKETADYAFKNAQLYLLKRDYFIKRKNQAKKENNSEKYQEAKQELKKLLTKIDNSIEDNLKKRKNKNFNQEEQDLIARYQMKYDLTTQDCSKQFGVTVAEILQYNKNLAERDAIFSEKWLWHQTRYITKTENSNRIDLLEDKNGIQK